MSDDSELRQAIEETHPDFVIVALEKQNRLPAVCHSILQDHPQLKIIAVAPDSNNSVFYWASLQVQSNQIEASEAGVLNALRSALNGPIRGFNDRIRADDACATPSA